jgi:hypothetical protein
MAERVGFEPTVPVKVQQFSRLPDSTTLAPLREATILGFTGIVFKFGLVWVQESANQGHGYHLKLAEKIRLHCYVALSREDLTYSFCSCTSNGHTSTQENS